MGPRFFLRTLPTTLFMAVATGVGLLLGRSARGAEVMALGVTAGLLCLLGAWTFRHSDATVFLLVGMALSVGLLTVRLPALDQPSGWLLPAELAFAGIMIGAVVGRSLRTQFQGAYALIWVAAWLVVIAMAALQIAGSPVEWLLPAAGAVVLVFTALAAAWFARVETEPPRLASLDLYLFGLNLFLAIAVLRDGAR